MNLRNPGARIPVVHSMHLWLSQTMTWLNMQVRSLPADIESHIVCDVSENLDQFPVENLTSADQDSMFWRFAGARSWQIQRRRQAMLLRNTITGQGALILHSHFGDRAWSNMEIAAQTRARHVVTYYGYDASRLPYISPEWRERYAALFETADLFLCEGPHLALSLRKLGCPPHKIKVHHLGINLGLIPFRPREWIAGEPLRVLIAGTFIEKKGIPYALEALARIKRRTALEINIVGDSNGQDRSLAEREQIQNAIDRGGLGPCTRLLGYRPVHELLEIAYRSHIFISPSVTASDGDTEGGAPVCLIEMAASGMPVVSTKHCDIPEVLQDGAANLLAEERDVDGLETRLWWLVQNRDEWREMLENVRYRIEAEFDAARQGRRLASHYESVVQSALH